jgi:regulator of ribonuclease activity A
MNFKTADLCDQFAAAVQVAEPLFRDYGGIKTFGGPIITVKVFEDNTLVRTLLETEGQGRVLVVDGGGSLRCALVGDRLAQLAGDNGWAGLVVNGCIRDSVEIAQIAVGLKALNTHPQKSRKGGSGEQNTPVQFAGVIFTPGHYLYADPDGLIVTERSLWGES